LCTYLAGEDRGQEGRYIAHERLANNDTERLPCYGMIQTVFADQKTHSERPDAILVAAHKLIKNFNKLSLWLTELGLDVLVRPGDSA
jgi:hypothetical protein